MRRRFQPQYWIVCYATAFLLAGIFTTSATCSDCGVLKFESPLFLPVVSNSLTTGDFNGDGYADLAATDVLAQSVSVFLGNRIGRFQPALNFAAAGRPRFVVAGYLNSDSVLDLAVANAQPASVAVLLGDGSGAFGLPSSFPLPFTPTSIAIGDFNADGDADLVSAGLGICLLLGDGVGGFTSPACFGAGGPSSLSVGDFNSDGKLDVVSAIQDHVDIRFGDGLGGLGAATNLALGTPGIGVSSLLTADFNKDGKLDLAVGKQRGTADVLQGDIYILLGNGSGGFGVPTRFAIVDGPRFIVVNDFDTDGNLDLAISNLGADSVSVLLGDGSGGFAPQTIFVVGELPAAMAVGDFNGDGHSDLATVKRQEDAIAIIFGDGGGEFRAPKAYATSHIPGSSGLAVADFNGDGKPDSAVTNVSGNSVNIFLADGSGDLSPAVEFSAGVNPSAVAAADFNGDAKFDLAVTTSDSNSISNDVFVLYGDGLGGFGIPNNIAQAQSSRSITANDLNGDGKADIAVADRVGNTVIVLLSSGPGSFSPASYYPVGTQPVSIAVGDFNGDGKSDIATANNGSSNISILSGTGNGEFAASINIHLGVQPNAVTADNFNSDSYSDLAVAVGNSAAIRVFLGTPELPTPFTSASMVGAVSVAAADLNGDGKLDLIAGSGSHSLSVFFGDGTGRFPTSSTFPLGGPEHIGVADLNSDTKPDLIITNYAGVAVLLNTCSPNTPSGDNVVVEAGMTTLVFDHVTTAGETTVTSIEPATIGDVPGGFAASEIVAYQITSTATFSGLITIGFVVPGPMTQADFNSLAILHNENGTLVDVTATSPPRVYATLTLYATATSLGPFYFVRKHPHIVPLFDQTKAHKVGSTVPIKISLFDSGNVNVSSPSIILSARDLRRVGDTTAASVIDSGNANPDNNFRYDSSLGTGGGYVFNLSTKGLIPGTYLLSFYAGDSRSFFYTVKFEAK